MSPPSTSSRTQQEAAACRLGVRDSFSSGRLVPFPPLAEVLIGELASRQTALRHFLNYLSESGDEALLGDVYRLLRAASFSPTWWRTRFFPVLSALRVRASLSLSALGRTEDAAVTPSHAPDSTDIWVNGVPLYSTFVRPLCLPVNSCCSTNGT